MIPLSKLNSGRICLLILSAMVSQVVPAQTPEDQAIPRLMQLSRIPTAASVDEILDLAAEGSTNQM